MGFLKLPARYTQCVSAMVPSLPSCCALGTCSDFLMHLTLLNSVKCSELDDRRCLKLAPLHWRLSSCASSET